MDQAEEYKKVREKVKAYEDVRSGDDLWIIEVLTTLQTEGKLSFTELGFMMHSILEGEFNEGI